jgi:hypothetical protein
MHQSTNTINDIVVDLIQVNTLVHIESRGRCTELFAIVMFVLVGKITSICYFETLDQY